MADYGNHGDYETAVNAAASEYEKQWDGKGGVAAKYPVLRPDPKDVGFKHYHPDVWTEVLEEKPRKRVD